MRTSALCPALAALTFFNLCVLLAVALSILVIGTSGLGTCPSTESSSGLSSKVKEFYYELLKPAEISLLSVLNIPTAVHHQPMLPADHRHQHWAEQQHSKV